jgi:hypothetical protein
MTAVVFGQRGRAPVLGRGVHTERFEDGDQRRFVDRGVCAGPVLVLGGHAESSRQFDQRPGQLCHGLNLALPQPVPDSGGGTSADGLLCL